MPNKILEGFLKAAKTASFEKTPVPSSVFFDPKTPSKIFGRHRAIACGFAIEGVY